MSYPFKKIIFDCKKATLIVVKLEVGQASFAERMQLWYHQQFCNPCRQFQKQSAHINRVLLTYSRQQEALHKISPTLKAIWEKQISDFKKG
ncbi:MAG: hypothetical protein J0L66_13085 [Cytophagales bacterium]|nr:hypothetical protein [Cytophagales bacterium]